eukprot:TRINITY_DN2361_c0_g1_i1.p1 TRINITY_DN2361_c0_g1~~TRINITY_DN2361_c0_g1_i1.p1  ORF type:complete len:389 (-),score=61.36 TRINITY_DN2361_c0_g1_i1:173-1339(-)
MNVYMNDDPPQAVVFDNGSSSIKIGMAGEDAPDGVFPSVVGRVRYPKGRCFLASRENSYISDAAQRKRGLLSLRYPIKHGVVTEWDDMEAIWHYAIYDRMRVDPGEHPFLFTEVPHNPKHNREKMANIMFETFEVPAFYVMLPAQLGAYASGRNSSFIVDSGGGVSHTMPIWQGHTVRNAILRQDLGGEDLTDYLSKLLLNERCVSLTTTAEREIVRDMKEKHSYVAWDYCIESKAFAFDPLYAEHEEKTYTLPDGQVVSMAEQRFRCAEVLFRPSLVGRSDLLGLHELVYQGIMNCEIDLRRDLFNNIVLSGGNTMFPGIAQRLEKELSKLVPPRCRVNVLQPQDRIYSTWIGGSILASLSTFQQMWITKQEYDEDGPAIAHRKCLF